MSLKIGSIAKFKYLGASHAALPELELTCAKEDNGVYLMFGTGDTIEGPAKEGQELLDLSANTKFVITKVIYDDDPAGKFKNRYPRPVLSLKIKPVEEAAK